MKAFWIGFVIGGLLCWPMTALASCQTWTIMQDGKIVTCTQCGSVISCF